MKITCLLLRVQLDCSHVLKHNIQCTKRRKKKAEGEKRDPKMLPLNVMLHKMPARFLQPIHSPITCSHDSPLWAKTALQFLDLMEIRHNNWDMNEVVTLHFTSAQSCDTTVNNDFMKLLFFHVLNREKLFPILQGFYFNWFIVLTQ